ncbi:MAG: hypothetical protein L0312_10785 [Acidobacteria bacterium]|nr:hypothetical protein [Acidobacteriota bacterium]
MAEQWHAGDGVQRPLRCRCLPRLMPSVSFRMDIAHWALLISILSFLVACGSLGWNIYREVALRARVIVTVAVGNVLAEGREPSPDQIFVGATNFGPGKVKLETIRLQKSSEWLKFLRRTKHAVIIHDYKNPLSGKLPTTLEVGEHVTYPFPLEKECFLGQDFTHVGICDSFGRVHWAARSDYVKARKRWMKTFGSES